MCLQGTGCHRCAMSNRTECKWRIQRPPCCALRARTAAAAKSAAAPRSRCQGPGRAGRVRAAEHCPPGYDCPVGRPHVNHCRAARRAARRTERRLPRGVRTGRSLHCRRARMDTCGNLPRTHRPCGQSRRPSNRTWAAGTPRTAAGMRSLVSFSEHFSSRFSFPQWTVRQVCPRPEEHLPAAPIPAFPLH